MYGRIAEADMLPAGVKLIPDPTELYPDSDGRRMADNTEQWEWIDTIKNGINSVIAADPDIFCAADNLIYAVEGKPKRRAAPDVCVAFGRPKGHRGSYKVWKEAGIFPQVVFEILSPGNRPAEMARKMNFYEVYGAEEYYIYDPDSNRLEIFIRTKEGVFARVLKSHNFVSPRLGIRFDLSGPVMVIYKPNGEPFLTAMEVEEQRTQFKRQAAKASARADQEQARADEMQAHAETERAKANAEQSKAESERAKADAMRAKAETAQAMADAERAKANAERAKAEFEREKANVEREKAEAERARAELLAAKLRELGIDPAVL